MKHIKFNVDIAKPKNIMFFELYGSGNFLGSGLLVHSTVDFFSFLYVHVMNIEKLKKTNDSTVADQKHKRREKSSRAVYT